jgi:hypothetical protein
MWATSVMYIMCCCRGTPRNALVQSAHQMSSPFVEAEGKGLIVSQYLTGEFPGADQLKIERIVEAHLKMPGRLPNPR